MAGRGLRVAARTPQPTDRGRAVRCGPTRPPGSLPHTADPDKRPHGRSPSRFRLHSDTNASPSVMIVFMARRHRGTFRDRRLRSVTSLSRNETAARPADAPSRAGSGPTGTPMGPLPHPSPFQPRTPPTRAAIRYRAAPSDPVQHAAPAAPTHDGATTPRPSRTPTAQQPQAKSRSGRNNHDREKEHLADFLNSSRQLSAHAKPSSPNWPVDRQCGRPSILDR